MVYADQRNLARQHGQIEQELAHDIQSKVRLKNNEPLHFVVVDHESLKKQGSELRLEKLPLLYLLLLQELEEYLDRDIGLSTPTFSIRTCFFDEEL
jgi:hypothetical protein